MGEVTVRVAGPADASTWRDLRHDALREAPYAFGSTYAREADWGEEVYAARLAAGLSVLGLLDGEPVGIGAGYVEDGRFHVVSVWVRPSARRRGVNTAVLHRLLDLASGLGLPVELQVAVDNPGARAAYERAGFEGTGELAPVREGSDQLEERMVLSR